MLNPAPVIEGVGQEPTSPLTTAVPAAVTPALAKTPNCCTSPRGGAVMALTWPPLSAAGARGPVGVRCEDEGPHPVCVTAAATISTGMARRRTRIIWASNLGLPGARRNINLHYAG